METIHHAPQRDPYLWKQAKARVGFRIHLRSFLIVNGGLWLVWAFTAFAVHSAGHAGTLFPWPVFAMIGWGIGLLSHYVSVFHRNEQNMVEHEYQKLVKQ
ncbi:2TM domain-containing protein [Spirosoma lituiforme]